MACGNAEGQRIDHAVQIGEARVRQAARQHSQRRFGSGNGTWRGDVEQPVFMAVGHRLAEKLDLLHMHSRVQREHQLPLGRKDESQRGVDAQRLGRFDGDLRLQPQKVRRRGVPMRGLGVLPRLALALGGNVRLP